jgi:hypothetical protein
LSCVQSVAREWVPSHQLPGLRTTKMSLIRVSLSANEMTVN